MVEKTKADRLAKKIRGGRQEGTEQDKNRKTGRHKLCRWDDLHGRWTHILEQV